MADFSFIDFNGNVFTLPNAPSSIFEYNNYIVIQGSNYYDFVFFDKILESSFITQGLVFNENNNAFSIGYRYSLTYNKWYEDSRVVKPTNASFVSCSDNILKYKDTLIHGSFILDLSHEEIEGSDEIQLFTLRPVVEEIHNDYDFISNSFNEIFSLLPVLIVCLVSFIGTRKAINWLFSLLRRS